MLKTHDHMATQEIYPCQQSEAGTGDWQERNRDKTEPGSHWERNAKGRVHFFQGVRGRCDIYLGVRSMKGTLVPREKLRQISRWEGEGSAGKAASSTQM